MSSTRRRFVVEGAGAMAAGLAGSAMGQGEPKGRQAGANEKAVVDAQTWPGQAFKGPPISPGR